jgi:hypothetical protein
LYNSVEQTNIEKLGKLLNKDSKYIRIEPNNRRTLRFDLSKTIEEVDKEYNGKTFKQYRFYVIEDNTEKVLDVGKTSAQAIFDKFNEGYKVLDIGRIGSGIGTRYIPRPVSSNIE